MKNQVDKSKSSLWGNNIALWLSSALILIGIIGMAKFRDIRFSPFITQSSNLYHELSRWAENISDYNIVYKFFLLDGVFAIGIFLLYGTLYLRFTDIVARGKKWTVFIIFFLMLTFDLIEGALFCNYFNKPKECWYFYYIPTIKLIFYGLGTLILLYYGLKKVLISDSYKKIKKIARIFFKNYFSYLYLSIFSIVVLFFMFSALDQFDVIIIELSNPWDLLCFTLLFLAHVLAVWFFPYYLQFTDKFYDKLRIEGKAVIGENIVVSERNYAELTKWYRVFFSITDVLKKQAKEDIKEEDEVKRNNRVREILAKVRPIKEEANKEKGFAANQLFHYIRRILGLGFIITFFTLQYDAYCKMGHIDTNFLCPGLFSVSLLAILILTTKCIDDEKKRLLGLGLTIFLGVSFLVSIIVAMYFYCAGALFSAHFSLMLATGFAGFGFIFFVVSRYPKEKRNTTEKVKWTGNIRSYVNAVIIFSLTVLIPILSILFFATCVFLPNISVLSLDLSSFTFVNQFNPTNIYLLMITGLMGIIAVIDRSIKLDKIRKAKPWRKKEDTTTAAAARKSINKTEKAAEEHKKNRKRFEKNTNKIEARINAIWLTLGICLLFVILMLRNVENLHHEVHYLDKEASTLTFDRYLKNFNDKLAPADTIHLIAAEGGGLRANYWTMLILEELGAEVYDKTFLYSGASGGAIGQGLYTYLNTLPAYSSESNRREYIKKMGASNFLSTDVAGLFTRDLVGAIIPFKTPKFPDRHNFNGQAYFDMMGTGITDEAMTKPFHTIWSKDTSQAKSPLIFVNTTRTEDGQRAVVHPFTDEDSITDPYLDISYNYDKKQPSYLDAVWLTNRFPVASPSARIEGKGHFVDGGYYENTGIKTLIHILAKMRGRALNGDEECENFFNHCIKVTSIHNSTDGYVSYLTNNNVLENCNYDNLNRSFKKKELSSIISAAANSGMTGLSQHYGEILLQKEPKELLNIAEYKQIMLPYLLNLDDIHNYFGGQIVQANTSLYNAILKNNEGIRKNMEGDKNVLMPPLSRMMTKPTADYMEQMVPIVVKDW